MYPYVPITEYGPFHNRSTTDHSGRWGQAGSMTSSFSRTDEKRNKRGRVRGTIRR